MSMLSYLRYNIAEVALESWLDESNFPALNSAEPSVDRSKLAWGLVHVCFLFLIPMDFINLLKSSRSTISSQYVSLRNR